MLRKFSPPALHHLVSCIHDTPVEVSKALVQRYLSKPPFSYRLLDTLVQLAMKADISQSQFDDAVRKHQPPKFQKIFLELTPLIHEHFSAIRPTFVLPVEPRKYLVNTLEIPFKPAFAFGLNNELIIPWFIFWKKNPLKDKQVSLLVTLIDDLLQQDPDYREAKIQIYDFSAPNGESRELKITDASTIPRLSSEEVSKALEIFVDGYKLAQIELEGIFKARVNAVWKQGNSQQQGLFLDSDSNNPPASSKPEPRE